MCGARSKQFGRTNQAVMGVASLASNIRPTGPDPEVHLCEMLSRIVDIATRLTAVSSPQPGLAGRKQLRRSFVSFVNAQEPVYNFWVYTSGVSNPVACASSTSAIRSPA